MMTGPITPVTSGSASYGLSWKSVSVMSVDGNVAVVRDQLSQTFKMNRTNLRAKGDLPAVGETWIVDRSYSDWSFAMIVHKDATRPPDLPPMVAVANQAQRDALIKYPNMTVYRIDTFSIQLWNGTNWVVQTAPKPPPPFSCRVKLNVDVSLTANTDVFAQTNWAAAAGDDLSGAFTPSPGGGVLCYITIPADGYYMVNFHGSCVGPLGSGQASNKVMRNNPSVAANTSIATDLRPFPPVSASDGAALNAFRARVKMFAGDTVYWSVWVSAAATLSSSVFGVPCEMTVQLVSPP